MPFACSDLFTLAIEVRILCTETRHVFLIKPFAVEIVSACSDATERLFMTLVTSEICKFKA
jgi:hypothetical protein